MNGIIDEVIRKKSNFESEIDDSDFHYEKVDLPMDTQIKIALNAFKSEQLNEFKEKYLLNEYHWNIIGLSYRKLGNYDLAEQAYLNAIELNPNYEEPYGNLMSLYIVLKNWDKYETIYNKGIKNASGTSFIIYQDGRFQLLNGNYDMAYSAALSVLKSDKMHNEPAFILGIKSLLKLSETQNIETKGKHLSDASLLLERALFVFPESVELIKLKDSYYFN